MMPCSQLVDTMIPGPLELTQVKPLLLPKAPEPGSWPADVSGDLERAIQWDSECHGSFPPGWRNQVIFQFQSFSFIHKMCQEPLSRKFKLKVNSTGTILSDKTADSGASWDNIYSSFLLMASATSQVITVMHLLNLTGAASLVVPPLNPC